MAPVPDHHSESGSYSDGYASSVTDNHGDALTATRATAGDPDFVLDYRFDYREGDGRHHLEHARFADEPDLAHHIPDFDSAAGVWEPEIGDFKNYELPPNSDR